MRSPFPGMNPYLEQPELWSAVHSRLIVAIADDLVDHLSQKYRVEVEKPTERYLEIREVATGQVVTTIEHGLRAKAQSDFGECDEFD